MPLRRWMANWCSDWMPRGIALFLGLFGLANLLGEFVTPGFDATLWWIDIPGCPRFLERGFLGWSAICLLWFALSRQLSRSAKIGHAVTLAILFEVSVWNAATVSTLIESTEIRTRSPVSFSTFVTAALAVVLCGVWATRTKRGNESECQRVADPGDPPPPDNPAHFLSTREAPATASKCWRPIAIGSTFLLCALGFPVAQMYCYGGTDYRRAADLIVILGAKVHSDGEVSAALDERLQTGCELYHQGLAPRLLMSGGPSLGHIHETEAMRDRAITLGVPADAILLDRDGLNTQLTAEHTVRFCQSRGWQRVLAVSQFYHLPRVKLAFHRNGMEVYTVPAEVRYRMRALPYFMLREVAALWMYYLYP